jgi:hypothetical protein
MATTQIVWRITLVLWSVSNPTMLFTSLKVTSRMTRLISHWVLITCASEAANWETPNKSSVSSSLLVQSQRSWWIPARPSTNSLPWKSRTIKLFWWFSSLSLLWLLFQVLLECHGSSLIWTSRRVTLDLLLSIFRTIRLPPRTTLIHWPDCSWVPAPG